MGMIKDILEKLHEKAENSAIFKSELLKACDDGYVEIIPHSVRNDNLIFIVFNVQINVKGSKYCIGQFRMVRECSYKYFNCLDGTVYEISLDELIKHGAKEIKKDELVS